MFCTSSMVKASGARAMMRPDCNTVRHGNCVIDTSDMRVAVRANNPEYRIYVHSMPKRILPDGHRH